jgi:hypothetical protein
MINEIRIERYRLLRPDVPGNVRVRPGHSASSTPLISRRDPSTSQFPRPWRLVSSGRSSRPHEPSSKSAEAQSLLREIANISGESDLRAFTGQALCSRCGAFAANFAVDWGRQESVNVADAVHAKAYDLSVGIDAVCEQHIHGGVSRNGGIEVSQPSALSELSLLCCLTLLLADR